MTIPEGVTRRRSAGAFSDCSNLGSVTIPAGVTEIQEFAFGNADLTAIVIPEGVVTIRNNAFGGCRNLHSITLPESVTELNEAAFQYTALTEVVIPGSVNKISDSRFGDSSSLVKMTIEEGVTELGKSAFSGCTNLTAVIIPESVSFIDGYTFGKCRNPLMHRLGLPLHGPIGTETMKEKEDSPDGR